MIKFLRSRKQILCSPKTVAGLLALALVLFALLRTVVDASQYYTEKQIDALATRVGKTFWVYSQDNNLPSFVNAPNAAAATFHPANKESFVVTEITGQSNKDPYYTVKFESGKIAYIRPEMFHEALNLTILSVDPFADEKLREEKQALEEKNRVDWIKTQPWPLAVKEAAIKKQPTPGLTGSEVKRVYGAPQRITKLRSPTKGTEEHWFYQDGSVLVIINGLFARMEKPPPKQ